MAKFLKGKQNFIPVLIFALAGAGFLLLNFVQLSDTAALISACLFAVTLIHSVIIINKFPYFRENYYFSFICCLLFVILSCCVENIRFYSAFFILSLILTQILFTYQNEIYIFNSFDFGFFLGFAVIFYPPFWIFAIYLICMYIFKGKTEIKGLIAALLGMVAFSILALEVVAVWDLWYLLDDFKEKLIIDTFVWKHQYFFLLPIFIPAGLGIWDYFSHINRQSASKKIVYFDVLLYSFFVFIFLIFYGGEHQILLFLLFIPMAIFTSNYLTYSRNILHKELILWGMLICLLLYRFHSYISLPKIFDQVTF
ncbi:MAG: DUF6427 family protein [Flavobacteriaceae bacterium]|nr:DUF6427 family protein [Flavobacteriaceae bacterium]